MSWKVHTICKVRDSSECEDAIKVKVCLFLDKLPRYARQTAKIVALRSSEKELTYDIFYDENESILS